MGEGVKFFIIRYKIYFIFFSKYFLPAFLLCVAQSEYVEIYFIFFYNIFILNPRYILSFLYYSDCIKRINYLDIFILS